MQRALDVGPKTDDAMAQANGHARRDGYLQLLCGERQTAFADSNFISESGAQWQVEIDHLTRPVLSNLGNGQADLGPACHASRDPAAKSIVVKGIQKRGLGKIMDVSADQSPEAVSTGHIKTAVLRMMFILRAGYDTACCPMP